MHSVSWGCLSFRSAAAIHCSNQLLLVLARFGATRRLQSPPQFVPSGCTVRRTLLLSASKRAPSVRQPGTTLFCRVAVWSPAPASGFCSWRTSLDALEDMNRLKSTPQLLPSGTILRGTGTLLLLVLVMGCTLSVGVVQAFRSFRVSSLAFRERQLENCHSPS